MVMIEVVVLAAIAMVVEQRFERQAGFRKLKSRAAGRRSGRGR
jgi:hypothetical protein